MVAVLGGGVWALVCGTLAQLIIAVILTMALERITVRPRLHLEAARTLLRFGGGYTAGIVATYFSDNVDNIVVGRTMGAQALGFYNRAFQLLAIPVQQVSTVLDRVLFPLLSAVQTEPDRLRVAYRRCMALLALISLPGSVALILLAPEIVHVLLGQQWDQVIAPFQVLAIAILPRLSTKFARLMVKATGAVYASAWRQAIFAPLVLVGAWVGSKWGLTGVAVGVVLANFVAQYMALQLSVGQTGLPWPALLRAHTNGILVATVCLAAGWPTVTALHAWGLPDAVVLFATGAVILAAALIVCALWPALFLGDDGRWAVSLVRRPRVRGMSHGTPA